MLITKVYLQKMTKLLRRVSQLTALGGAAGVGWLLGSNHSHKSSLLQSLPFFDTLSAAAPQGSIISTEATDIVPPPSPNASRISQIMRFGFPGLSNIRALDDYVLSYDTRNRVPNWVCEHLTADNLAKKSDVDRSKCDFHEDLSIHEFFRSENRDYKGSGFDRGHMAAAGNHRLSLEDCRQTFLLSNMAPQVGKGFNRDKWNDLEQYCRKLARENANVYVCTGPLYIPRREDDGKLYIKYQVIGQNHVAVPTHFFKVVVCENKNGELELESYLLPNMEIDDSTPLSTFQVPAEVIERASGLLIFDKIDKKKLGKLNAHIQHFLWLTQSLPDTREKFQRLYFT
ncbi:endonuclease G, mitochondrial isoform X3 [Panulirus ornatus]|uniref:endonuclease G, mitochondrial isoform X3 n=1 Tax=Panulirus ornatus TaxID=150431 RepID=UPI003A85BD53